MAEAFAPLAQLVAEIEHGAHHVDAAFTGHQVLAGAAMARGEGAATHLRALVAIARTHASPEDEIEARIALSSALVATGRADRARRGDAHDPIAAIRALETICGRCSARPARAGWGARARRQDAGALDRALELARVAQAEGDVNGYVAMVGVMAELYARTGDHVSAFRTIVESHAALVRGTRDRYDRAVSRAPRPAARSRRPAAARAHRGRRRAREPPREWDRSRETLAGARSWGSQSSRRGGG